MGKQYDDDEVEIDLRAIFLELKKKLWMILAAVVAGGCIGGLYSAVVLTPTYTSTSMMYVLSKETTLTSLADLQMGSQLTLDYTVLVTSRPVVEARGPSSKVRYTRFSCAHASEKAGSLSASRAPRCAANTRRRAKKRSRGTYFFCIFPSWVIFTKIFTFSAGRAIIEYMKIALAREEEGL